MIVYDPKGEGLYEKTEWADVDLVYKVSGTIDNVAVAFCKLSLVQFTHTV